MRSLGIGLAVGAGLGGVGTYLFLNRPKQKQEIQPGASVQHPALKYGYPITAPMRHFTNFVVSFDTSRRNPSWVLEYVTRDTSSGPGDRKNSDFYEEKSLETRFRNHLGDFKNSGYDRGHMAPAQNHKGSQQAMDETHSLINISPQVGKGFNRDYWSRFEAFVKRLASGKGHEVFVVTGPLYLPHRAPDGKGWVMEHPMLGEPPSMVSVPTHFYKVVLVEQKGSEAGRPARLSCGAFVMPNAPIDPAMPLEAFAVPLTQLESVSGLTFFPGLINEERRLQLDGSSVRCRQAALASLSSTSTVPLLEGSSSAAAPANKSPSPGAKQPAHLCEAFACKLPAQEFWLSSKQSPEDVEVEE